MTNEQEGWRLKKEKKYTDAIKAFDRAIRLDDRVYSVLYGQGECFLELGRIDEALGCFNEAVRMDPRSHLAYHGCGRCYYLKKEYNAAAEAFEQSLRRQNRSTIAWMGLGKCYLAQDRPKEAEEPLRRSLKGALVHHPELVEEINRLLDSCTARVDSSDETVCLKDTILRLELQVRDLSSDIDLLKQENLRLRLENQALSKLLERPVTHIHAGGNVNVGGVQANDAGTVDGGDMRH